MENPQKEIAGVKIAKILGVLTGIVLATILVWKGFGIIQNVFTKASDSAPRNVMISDVSHNGAQVAWSTDQETEAIIKYGTAPASLHYLVPEKQNGKQHVIHFGGEAVNNLALLPDTTYYFHIQIGDKIYDDNGIPWSFTTQTQQNTPASTSAFGPLKGSTLKVNQVPTPTIYLVPTLSIYVCGETDCQKICQKIGKTCSTQDWLRSGCVGKVTLSTCDSISISSPNTGSSALPSIPPSVTPSFTYPPVQTLKSPTEIGKLQPYISANFKLYTDSDRQKAESYLFFFEGFKKYFSKNYFDVAGTSVVSVYLFSNPGDFELYKTNDSPYGYYLYTEKIIVTHGQAGWGTYAHELTHSFMYARLTTYPEWLVEGLPTFFEKLIGYYDSTQDMKLVVGFQNPWRVEEFINGINAGSIQKPTLLSTARHQATKGAERFLGVYLYQRGWLKTYTNKFIQNPSTDPNVDAIIAASGKSLSALEEDWSKWLDQIVIDAKSPQSTLTLIPVSFVLPNKTEWDSWLNIHRSELQRIGVDYGI